MKIAYVGDFVNHGKSLAPTGTSVVFLLSMFDCVESIDVYCPQKNEDVEKLNLPSKIKVIESYRYDSAYSLLNLLKLRHSFYDKVIFNILSTAFGSSSISNAMGISIPIILLKMFRMNNIEVIYHNSVLTNDVEKLGYTSIYDKLRSKVLKFIESYMFKNVKTFVLLELYKEKINHIFLKNKANHLNARYLEAMATIFINELQGSETMTLDASRNIPRILLHGNWGPQKNIELALASLDKLRSKGITFDLAITGGINHHFPQYEQQFMSTLKQYDFLKSYIGTISEKKILEVFTTSDILMLPYNTPGGHSAVLEQAIFFEIPTIAIDFPEYREEAIGKEFITLTSPTNLYRALRSTLAEHKVSTTISIRTKILEAKENISLLLK